MSRTTTVLGWTAVGGALGAIAYTLLRPRPAVAAPLPVSPPLPLEPAPIPIVEEPPPGSFDKLVNTLLPREGPGFVALSPPANSWGRPEVIGTLIRLGQLWAARHPAGPRIVYHDVSYHGGGPMAGHKSHQLGVDVDVGVMRNDGVTGDTAIDEPSYSRELTQELIDAFRMISYPKAGLIFFNDPAAHGVMSWPGHEDHLHVRFEE